MVTRTPTLMVVLIIHLGGIALAGAQTHPVVQSEIPLNISTGQLDNPTDGELLVYDEVVEIADAFWMRLRFQQVSLEPGSYLLITSLQDGAAQTLDRVSIAQWHNRTAYFNGSALRVQLYAGAETFGNGFTLDAVIRGEVDPGDIIASQCGPSDDRVLSNEASRARLLDIGCTASIFSTESCFITAGHCLSFAADVVEFNVPLSQPNGNIQHPGPQDQYVVNSASREYVNGGIGNDWGLFRVFANSSTGLMPYEAQGEYVELDTVLPDLPEDIDLVGYGIDDGVDNQVQQRSVGPITSITGGSAPTVFHQADTEGGSSGSAIRSRTTGKVIAIHTHAGCSTGGGGSNASTGITNAGLQDALIDFCVVDDTGIPCEDIVLIGSQCTFNGRIRFRAWFADHSHDGDTVTIAIDGHPIVLPILNRLARFQMAGFSGTHIVTLEDPPDCVGDMIVQCP
ncbi:MAG: hypothetical protein IID37_15825 [Planctomycetes bacterium]|nr:hypothetical protein [Planctomycetota bacterium]